MKRKVIQQGPATLMVSLPSKWVKKYGIKKGDEVELEEQGRRLTVSTEKEPAISRHTLDISYFTDEALIRRMIVSLYKRGIDELEIKLRGPEQIKSVNSSLYEMIGYEIVNQGKNYCILKSIASGMDSELDQIIRRTFLVVLNISKKTLESLENSDVESLKEIDLLEITVNKLTTFCQRLITKKGYVDHTKSIFMFSILQELEHIADEYDALARYLKEANNIKISKDTLALCKEVNDLLELFYQLYYDYDDKRCQELTIKRRGIIKEGYKLIKIKKGQDPR